MTLVKLMNRDIDDFGLKIYIFEQEACFICYFYQVQLNRCI